MYHNSNSSQPTLGIIDTRATYISLEGVVQEDGTVTLATQTSLFLKHRKSVFTFMYLRLHSVKGN